MLPLNRLPCPRYQGKKPDLLPMRRTTALLAMIAALPLLAETATPVRASGPIDATLRDLPRPIAKLHTCIRPRERMLLFPDTWRVGKQHVFQIGCPENATTVTP